MALQRAANSKQWQELTELVQSARALDVHAFEEKPLQACQRDLVPRVDGLIERGIAMASAIADHYDDPAAPPPEKGSLRESLRPCTATSQAAPAQAPAEQERASTHFHFQMDALVEDQARGPALVADIAFVASMELREKRAQLSRTAARADSDHWELVEACASARRRLLKSATALELVLCEVEGLEPAFDYRTELTVALEVRRRYAALRRTIDPDHPPEGEALLARLRVIGTRIAMLVGLDIYPDLRLRDRIQMRALQKRILAWLGGAQDPREGMRLWGDLVGFADLIAQVSKRQELVEHDTALARQVLAQLEMQGAQGEVGPDTFAQLLSLRGVSAEVDAMLDAGERNAARWKHCLQDLGRAGQGAQSGHNAFEPLPASSGLWVGGVSDGGRR